MQIDYRLTIYDDDGTTVLTPRAGSVHSDPFRVATIKGLAGYKGYLDLPRGKSATIDLLKPKVSIGSQTLEIMDKRTTEGGSNLSRWVTAFVGDEHGLPNLIGKKAFLEERVDGGAWTAMVTGVVGDSGIGRSREWIQLTIKENGERLKAEVFNSRPHPDVTYADGHSLLPYGPAIQFGGFDATPLIPGTVRAWSRTGYGSGFLVNVDKSAIETADGRMEVAYAFDPLLDAVEGLPESQKFLSTVHCDLYTTAGALIGTYRLERLPGLTQNGYVHFKAIGKDLVASQIGIAELDVNHPRHAAMPVADTAVEFRLVNAGEPTEAAPIHVDTVSPIDFLADVLDGKFSEYLSDGVTPATSIPRDATAFSAIETARPFARGRWPIKEPLKVNDFLEDVLGAPHRLAYRFDGDGEIVPIDIRLPSTLAGVPKITNADLVTVPAPGWNVELEQAVSEVRIRHYSDNQNKPYLTVTQGNFIQFDVTQNKPTWIGESEHVTAALFDNPGRGRGDPYEVDAIGFRHSIGVDNPILNIGPALLARARIDGLVQEFRTLFSGALAGTVLACRRTANTSDCMPGDLRIIDVDEVPDAATNLRGGPRVGRCIEREPRGDTIRLVFADLGADVVAVSPSLGVVSLVAGEGTHAAKVPVTLNAAGEPAVVHFAVTPTSTSTRPAESDPLWQFGVRLTASGDAVVNGLPSGTRVWFRGRSEPGGEELKIPSGWVFPSGDGFVNTTGIAAPTGLAVTVEGSDAFVDFTPGDPDFSTEMWLRQGAGAWQMIETLPPGSTRAPYRNLEVASYTAGLQHRDERAGVSSRTTIPFSIGTATVSPELIGATLIVGVSG